MPRSTTIKVDPEKVFEAGAAYAEARAAMADFDASGWDEGQRARLAHRVIRTHDDFREALGLDFVAYEPHPEEMP